MKRAISVVRSDMVNLRLIEENDLEMTLLWRNRDEVRSCFKYSAVITPEQHLAWFKGYERKDNDFVFVVEAEGVVVGQVSVYGIDWDKGEAEVGRFLAAPGHSGKGYIRAACELLIELCWAELGLNYIFLEVFEHNDRAVRLYQALGFSKENSDSQLLRFGLSRFGKDRRAK